MDDDVVAPRKTVKAVVDTVVTVVRVQSSSPRRLAWLSFLRRWLDFVQNVRPASVRLRIERESGGAAFDWIEADLSAGARIRPPPVKTRILANGERLVGDAAGDSTN